MVPVIRRDEAMMDARGEMKLAMAVDRVPTQQEVSVRLNAILQKISYAETPSIRCHALQDLHHILSHDDESARAHDDALKQGADRLLSWQLTCNLQESSVDHRVLLSILVCLEVLWARCRHEHLKKSVLGLIDVLPWFFHVWQRFPENHNLVEVVISILRTWSRLKETRLKTRLIRSGIVQCIRKEATCAASRPAERRTLLAFGLLKDLTFRSIPRDREFLYTSLKEVILQTCQGESCEVVHDMSITLWNLSSEQSVGEKMAEDQQFWDTIKRLWNIQVEADSITIHRNVSSTVGTIVASIISDSGKNTAPVLLLEQSWLLPALLEVLSNECDKDWRRRCMRTIRCLATCDWGRDFLWMHSTSIENLVAVLVRVLQSPEDDSDTRVQACQAIGSILPFKGHDLTPLGPCLETALIQTLNDSSVNDKLVVAASQTLSVSLCHSPWKRAPTCFSTSLMERIRLTLSQNQDDPACHNSFSGLFVQLIREPSTKKKLSSFASTPVLNTLTRLLEPVGPEFYQSRKNAVEVLTVLSADSSCRKRLAENEGLLTALVNFCLIASDPLKESAKSTLLLLVPEL